MTDMQVLFKVRLPLALPVIMAGIRISSVTDTPGRFQRVGADIAQPGTGIFQNGQQ